MSAKLLNDEFRRINGQTIYNVITERRLVEAHDVLQSTPVPIKQLAAQLGYAHVNHFSAAFKKKFSYPPGSLRRSKQL